MDHGALEMTLATVADTGSEIWNASTSRRSGNHRSKTVGCVRQVVQIGEQGLSEPLRVEYPGGMTAGGFIDLWQR
jgi:hypothetical protein